MGKDFTDKRQAHRANLERMKPEMKEKVKHLIEAINRANEAAKAARERNDNDDGTSNGDSIVIRLPRWSAEDLKAVTDATGAHISDQLSSAWFKGYRFLRTTTEGQANLRSRMMDAALQSLKGETPRLDVRGYYQAD